MSSRRRTTEDTERKPRVEARHAVQIVVGLVIIVVCLVFADDLSYRHQMRNIPSLATGQEIRDVFGEPEAVGYACIGFEDASVLCYSRGLFQYRVYLSTGPKRHACGEYRFWRRELKRPLERVVDALAP
jgi:hypothetical protein